jgi:hypothetical protein
MSAKFNQETHVHLPADTNQALGIAQYAIDFMSATPGKRGEPSPAVMAKTNQFHTDAVIAGISALALGTNAPNLLRVARGRALGEGRGPHWRAGLRVVGERRGREGVRGELLGGA